MHLLYSLFSAISKSRAVRSSLLLDPEAAGSQPELGEGISVLVLDRRAGADLVGNLARYELAVAWGGEELAAFDYYLAA